MNEMICIRCKKVIEPKSNYHKNIEMNNEEEVRTDYIHQTCWEEFTLQTNKAHESLNKASGLLNSLGGYMKKSGLISQEEVWEL
jgi:hypothetical protein